MSKSSSGNTPKKILFSTLLVCVVLSAIWFPEFSHWFVGPVSPTQQVLEATRLSPQRSVLDEVAMLGLGVVELAPEQIVNSADQVMHGRLGLPGFPTATINLPFSPRDLSSGLPTFQLMVASLASADILLDGYRMTRREEFFRQTQEIIVRFAEYEAAQWVNQGFMWNDHAIGARITVLVKFWAEYRTRPTFDPRIGRLVLSLVARSARLLSKPSFYAWRTGHGIVSDLAILQIATAFPDLEGMADLRDVAADRFRNHLNYWISEEGVALLHSAGYHSSALYFFGVAMRLYTLNGIKIPEEWWTRYKKAVDFYALLRRPDGTLPMYGDTSSMPDLTVRLLTTERNSSGGAKVLTQRTPSLPVNGLNVYPMAGHAIVWDGSSQVDSAKLDGAQTAITWSYHPGLGHKIADELSMLVWANGRTWLTNTGYWPYGTVGREQAESWSASNAPHLFGESKDSDRKSRVIGVGQDRGIAVLDLERVGPTGYSVRRQIVRLANEKSWLVLDHATGSETRRTTTNWTFYPDLSVIPLASNAQYRVTTQNSSLEMVCSFSGSEGFTTELVTGSESPFAGWVVLDRTPTRATAIVSSYPSRASWSLALFSLVNSKSTSVSPKVVSMEKWVDADHWTVVVPVELGDVRLTRTGSRLVARRSVAPGDDLTIDLVPSEAPLAAIAAEQEGILWASKNFHQFRELITYRVKVSYLLLALFISQELLFFVANRRLGQAVHILRISSWFFWSVGGFWLSQIYLVAPP